MSIMVIMMVMVVSPENMKVEEEVEEVAKVSGWVRDSPTHTGLTTLGSIRYRTIPFQPFTI